MPLPTTHSTLSRPDHSEDGPDLEARIIRIGQELHDRLADGVFEIPEANGGPIAFARRVGIDKVLASRVFKTVRSEDPLAAVHRAPGPDPLRRLLKAMARAGVSEEAISGATRAVDEFEALIRDDFGDRGALDAVVSAWVPEARREFELRRKQSAFKAMAQLKGAQADTIVASVFLHPSPDGDHIDVTWITGLVGLQRLRPGASVKFATRRFGDPEEERTPETLDGHLIESQTELLLEQFCSSPTPQLRARKVENAVLYSLEGKNFGPRSAMDLMSAEVNRADIARYSIPPSTRKAFVFAEVSTPAKVIQFDALVHEDLARMGEPTLRIYDTALEGVANVNDPSRDPDRIELLETIESLGRGIGRCRSSLVPRYSDLLRLVCDKLGWDGGAFHAHRCRIDYPLYGSQVTMAFDHPRRPEDDASQ